MFSQIGQVVERPLAQDVDELRTHLRHYNMTQARGDDGYGLGIFWRDESGALMAGINGWLWGAVLEIDHLWVHETWRHQGVGKRLVQALEEAAHARGCRQVTLATFTFQAPAFYRRLGYQVFGIVGGYGHRYRKIYMQKRLEA